MMESNRRERNEDAIVVTDAEHILYDSHRIATAQPLSEIPQMRLNGLRLH